MDSTIIKVINKMIMNSDKIGNIVLYPGNPLSDFFFLYDSKHIWEIILTGVPDDFLLFYYRERSIINLINDPKRFEKAMMYSAQDFKSREATESFRELFLIIKQRTYGMDQVFQDILSS